MLPLDGVHVLFDDETEPPLESISNRKNALRHGSNPLPHQAPQDFFAALTQHRFLMLFLFLLATLVAYPHTEGRSTRFYDFRALSALIIALSVYSGFEPAHDSRPLRLR